MEIKRSILVSNVLDPLTKDSKSLEEMYNQLAELNRYQGIETRLIEDKDLREKFNHLVKANKWDVTYWITGQLSREELNLSSADEILRSKTINRVKSLMLEASEHCGNYIGIASGSRLEGVDIESQIEIFSKSIIELINYKKENQINYKFILEPLDIFAHKKQVIGDTECTLKLISYLKKEVLDLNEHFAVCWDSAHFVLNNDNLEQSFKELAPYIVKIHLADVINNINNDEYGDNHRHFDDKGVMDVNFARRVLTYAHKYITAKEIYLSCEARTKVLEEAWKYEEFYWQFLNQVLQ